MCNNSNGKIDSLVSVIVMLESMLTDAHGYNQQLAEQYRESQKQLTDLMSRFNERGNELVDQDGQIKDLRSRLVAFDSLKSAVSPQGIIEYIEGLQDRCKVAEAERDSQLQRITAAEQSRETAHQLGERLGACTKSRTNLMLIARKRRLALNELLNWFEDTENHEEISIDLLHRAQHAARPVDYETGLPIREEPCCPMCYRPVTALSGGADYGCECGAWRLKDGTWKANPTLYTTETNPAGQTQEQETAPQPQAGS